MLHRGFHTVFQEKEFVVIGEIPLIRGGPVAQQIIFPIQGTQEEGVPFRWCTAAPCRPDFCPVLLEIQRKLISGFGQTQCLRDAVVVYIRFRKAFFRGGIARVG